MLARALLLVLTACGDATAPGCPDCSLVAEVRGIVRTDVDDLVEGARVRVRAVRAPTGSCDEVSGSAGQATEIETDRFGGFSVLLNTPSGEAPMCVEVAVDPPAASSLAPVTDTFPTAFVPGGVTLPLTDVTITLHGDG